MSLTRVLRRLRGRLWRWIDSYESPADQAFVKWTFRHDCANHERRP